MRWTTTWATMLITTACCFGDGALTDEQRAELARYFGFGPMQMYRLKRGIGDLHIADLNGDGRKDLVLWNGQQSRFEILFQPDPNAPAAGDAAPRERNEVADRGTHRKASFPVNYKVASVGIGDVTGDGRNDIVFFGEPRELVVIPQKADGELGAPDSQRAPEGNPRRASLALGDFNHDGRTDAALLGTELLLVFLQRESGGLAPPLRLTHGIRNPTIMLSGDINGDGRDDLIIGADDDRHGVYVCLQEQSGTLAALRPIRVPRHRSLTVAPPAGGAGSGDVFAVELATNRLVQYRWQLPTNPATARDWPQRLHSYPIKSAGKQRPLALGDVDGDGLVDCVAVDPDAAQMILFRGEADGLGAGIAFPGLVKATDVQIADVDGDGRNEVLLASGEEKMIAVSRYEGGRLSFPAPLPTSGQPLAVAVGSLVAGQRADRFAYVAKHSDGYRLSLRPLTGGEDVTVGLDDLGDDPSGLRFFDFDQDGRNDLMIFVRMGVPRALRQKDDGTFETFGGSERRVSLLKEPGPAGFAFADVTGDGKPELLLAQDSFVRALVVRDGRWTVVDQYNPESSDARVVGVAALPGPSGHPTIVAYERRAGDLVVFQRREDGAYGVTQSMPIGAFELTAMASLPIGPSGSPAALLADAAKLAVLRPEEQAPTLVEQHSYETQVKDAWLADAVVGDVNNDGIRDVIAVDMGKAALEVLTTLPDGGLVLATRFQVFQGRRFMDVPDTRGEPREVLAGDVTGDGIDDLAVIAHDRLIIYPGQ
ncbi:MAG: VCBS repeat-containing protein [Phycisphaerales bacterium]|nr:VCBS repeat-containing protein [Phycisphaerales bacterium]